MINGIALDGRIVGSGMRLLLLAVWAGAVAFNSGGRAAAATDFTNFESSHVHPLALSQDRTRLYAVNTPEARLSIFKVEPNGALALAGDVAVGLEPVSLAVRPGTSEVWVANHLSDSVTIVDGLDGVVLGTLHVGDEPNDIAFAAGRAFVALGGNEDRIKVFDASTLQPLAALDIFSDTPRALAVSSDGLHVYAMAMDSGNQTTALHPSIVRNNGGPPPPNPPRQPSLPAAPGTALIVKFDPATNRWLDDTDRDWGSTVRYSLPDHDVFVIDAAAAVPEIVRTVSGVGTTLFDVAVQPGTGKLFVSNTEARNLVRFEPNLRGHIVETRLSVVDPATASVEAIDLNPHINRALSPGPAPEIAASLSQPGQGVFNSDGTTLYLTAFGSQKVAVIDAASGAVTARIQTGGGPSGVALNEPAQRLYVMRRFDNLISIIDTGAGAEVDAIGVSGPAGFDPSPDVIKLGRRFLYDAQLTSGHGDSSCGTCHVFGNFDGLAWDLGDPTGELLLYAAAPWLEFFPSAPFRSSFDPMKGPMVTQSLRGLKGQEPFHWRGDRRDFQHFNGAFVGLMGRDTPLPAADMDAFTDFILGIPYPPNPFRNLDDTMPATMLVPAESGGGDLISVNPTNGEDVFSNVHTADGGQFACGTCHELPTGTSRKIQPSLLSSQDSKISQLRGMYTKVGYDVVRGLGLIPIIGAAEQRRGFGFLREGSISMVEFLRGFNLTMPQRADVHAFMLAFPGDMKPLVGFQQSVEAATANDPDVVQTIATMLQQAAAGSGDVTVKGRIDGVDRGYVYDAALATFVPDSQLEDSATEASLRQMLRSGERMTFMGVPADSGRRLGIDRDRDGWLDRDEIEGASDPADPYSEPVTCLTGAIEGIQSPYLKVARNRAAAGDQTLTVRGELPLPAPISPPLNPGASGLLLRVIGRDGRPIFTQVLPAGMRAGRSTSGWIVSRTGKRWTFIDRSRGVAGGITRVVVRDRSDENPGLVSVRVRGRGGNFQLAATQLPVRVVIILGGRDQAAAGHCATRSSFPQIGCRLSSAGRIVTCR